MQDNENNICQISILYLHKFGMLLTYERVCNSKINLSIQGVSVCIYHFHIETKYPQYNFNVNQLCILYLIVTSCIAQKLLNDLLI